MVTFQGSDILLINYIPRYWQSMTVPLLWINSCLCCITS